MGVERLPKDCSLEDVAKWLYEKQLKWRGIDGGNVPPFDKLRDSITNYWKAEAESLLSIMGLEVKDGKVYDKAVD